MPFNGSGTFVSLPAPDFPALPGTTILASAFNANMNDVFINGLTNCLTRDGQSPPTANLPMAGFKFTSLGNGVNDSDSAALGQTLALRGQVGTVDWNTRTSTGIFEATSASLTTPSTNFPPTVDLGQLVVLSQGATVGHLYVTANTTYIRQKLSGTWSVWTVAEPRRNYIINSGCQIWQDGTSLVSGTGKRYLMDMCYDDSTGSTYVPTQQTFPLGQTDVPPQALFFKRTVVTSVAGASNFCAETYPIEFVRTLGGKQVVVSFYAKAGATIPVAVEVSQNFGTGGGPSAQVDTFGAKVTLATTWARYQIPITLPSISGKTLGTSGDCLQVRFWFDAGSTFNTRTGTLGQQSGTFDIFGVKIEEGSYMSGYEIPEFSEALAQCYRQYVNRPSTTRSSLMWAGNTVAGSGYLAAVEFPTEMRATPSVTATLLAGAVGFPGTNPSIGATTTTLQGIMVANGTVNGGVWQASYTASARL